MCASHLPFCSWQCPTHPLLCFVSLGTAFPSLLWQLDFIVFDQGEALAEFWEKKIRMSKYFFLLFLCFNFIPWQWFYLLCDSDSIGKPLPSVVTVLVQVPTRVLVPQGWSTTQSCENNTSSLCPSNYWSSKWFLLFLISQSPHHYLVNTSMIYITNSLY